MRQVLHIRAQASLFAIQATISHTKAKRLALVFPLGAQTALSADTLESLAGSCRASGTDVAIIGGDEALRAGAVAAGFAVATTLDEWETGTMPAIRHTRPLSLRRAAREPEWREPHLRLVDNDEDDELSALDPEWEDQPPEFVVELMEQDGAYPGADADPVAIPEQEQPEDDEERVRREAESYEDHMTGRIRRTGGQPSRPVSDALLMPSVRESGGNNGSETESP
ncbi:MAG TPA: hypothetical protein VF120_07840 [Ktedonobacterales bacterium]